MNIAVSERFVKRGERVPFIRPRLFDDAPDEKPTARFYVEHRAENVHAYSVLQTRRFDKLAKIIRHRFVSRSGQYNKEQSYKPRVFSARGDDLADGEPTLFYRFFKLGLNKIEPAEVLVADDVCAAAVRAVRPILDARHALRLGVAKIRARYEDHLIQRVGKRVIMQRVELRYARSKPVEPVAEQHAQSVLVRVEPRRGAAVVPRPMVHVPFLVDGKYALRERPELAVKTACYKLSDIPVFYFAELFGEPLFFEFIDVSVHFLRSE